MAIARAVLLFTAWLCLAPAVCLAKDVVLYENGRQVRQYGKQLRSVEPGDVIEFSHTKFRVVRKLDEGGAEFIFDLGDGRVLRVSRYYWDGDITPDNYLKGYPELRRNGVDMVDVFPQQSEPGEYVIARRVPVLERLDQYLASRPGLTTQARAERDRKLLEFARSTKKFSEIADFRAPNIVWTGERWILLDWDVSHRLASAVDSLTAFDQIAELPPELNSQLTREIRAARSKDGFTREVGGPFCIENGGPTLKTFEPIARFCM